MNAVVKGFNTMTRERHRQVCSQGGKAQGKHNNPANFANDPAKASRAAKISWISRRARKALDRVPL